MERLTPSFVIPSAAEGSAVPRTFPGNVFRLILDGNAEAKLLRLDGILSLCFCQQAGLFGHLLRLRSISQSLISPAKLVVRCGVAWIQLQHLLKFFPRAFPLLQLHIEETQLIVRFDHRWPQ